jgi:uncharacterized membrane protein YdjX (TVP38/TMEM64 family)
VKKRKLKINYLKFVLFIIALFLAYFIFYERNLSAVHKFISSIGYFGTFFAGMLYTYGFTSPPATAIILLLAEEQNVILASLIGGFGALLNDIIIFKTINYSFKEEINFLLKGKKYLNFLPKYVFTILGALIIASPLPDELGISLMVFDKNLLMKNFLLISYILNTIGIFIILLIGKSI